MENVVKGFLSYRYIFVNFISVQIKYHSPRLGPLLFAPELELALVCGISEILEEPLLVYSTIGLSTMSMTFR